MDTTTARRDARVDAYIRKAATFAQPILGHLRALVHKGCPQVQETIKWGVPHFDYKGIFCSMAAFRHHVAFGFWKGQLLSRQGLPKTTEKAMGQFGRLATLDDLPDDKKMLGLVRAAAKLNDDGVKISRAARAVKPPVKVPGYFAEALRANEKARAAFEKFPPSHKREYVQWVTEAKTEATRTRRLTTALEWMAKGKSRNWRYER
jgi:hypothetical protein